MVSVGVISPRKLIRRALCSLLLVLSIPGGLCIQLDADTVADASDRIIASKPQLLLVDCDGRANCLNCIHRCCHTARTLSPSTRCLLLADDPGEEFSVQAVRSGAWGLVTSRSDPVLMQQAIEKVVRGEMWFSHVMMAKAIETFVRRKPPEDSAIGKLTPREAAVMALLVQGYHNKQIAQRLFLSVNTVRRYAETIYKKLGVNSRLEVALWYQKHRNLMPQPADRHF